LMTVREMAFKGEIPSGYRRGGPISISGPISSTIKDDILNSIMKDYHAGVKGIIRHSNVILQLAGDDPDVSPDILKNLLQIFIDLYDENPGNFPKGSWRFMLGKLMSNNNIPLDLVRQLANKKGPDSKFFARYVLSGLTRNASSRAIKPGSAIRKDLDDDILIQLYERLVGPDARNHELGQQKEYEKELFRLLMQYPNAKTWDTMIVDAGTLRRNRMLKAMREEARQNAGQQKLNEIMLREFIRLSFR